MIAKVIYSGFHRLGDDFEIDGVKVMQTQWKEIVKPFIFPFGKSRDGVNPFLCTPFISEYNGKQAFFLAHENGVGKYYIFTFSKKAQEKLSSRIKTK